MKAKKYILLTVLSLAMFAGGFFTSKMTSEEVTREIRFGVQNAEQEERIDFITSITDKKDQAAIDNVTMILMYSTVIQDEKVDLENPDVYLEVLSPKQSTGLIDSRIWFTSDGAIIGDRLGATWDKVEYRSIDQIDADYLKGLMKKK